MANQPNQKLKLLYVLKALLDKTDDINGITTQDLIEELAYRGIDAERKSVNRDIQTLRDFGFDIRQRSRKYWYIANRPLELQEMIMLVDAVQSAPFLTDRLTDELIERIKQFASIDQRKMLARRIEVPGRIKMQNEGVLQNLDIVQQAMRRKRKVEFQYFRYDLEKRRVARKGGNAYLTTPVRLVYADEFYYLVAFSDYWAEHGGNAFAPYRVDRMMNVRVSEEAATKDPRIANYRTEERISPSFGVYAADKVGVVLEADEEAMNLVIDKFGVDALVFTKEDDRVQVNVRAPLSPQFYGWLLMLAPHVKITYPTRAVEEFTKMLERTQKMYRKSYRICSATAGRLVSQEQFLELVEHVEDGLRDHADAEPAGAGFGSENDFDEAAWRLISEWTAERGIDDGMNYGTREVPRKGGGTRRLPLGLSRDDYMAYGQLVGEAIAAIEPARFAAEGREGDFLDTAARFDAGKGFAFSFREPRQMAGWRRVAEDTKRWSVREGVWFDMKYADPRDRDSARCLFNAPAFGCEDVDVRAWMRVPEDGGAWKAAAKLWQMIAYRFV